MKGLRKKLPYLHLSLKIRKNNFPQIYLYVPMPVCKLAEMMKLIFDTFYINLYYAVGIKFVVCCDKQIGHHKQINKLGHSQLLKNGNSFFEDSGSLTM